MSGRVELSPQYIAQLIREEQDVPVQVVAVDTLPTSAKNPVNKATFDTFLQGTVYKASTLTQLQEQTDALVMRLQQANIVAAAVPIIETSRSSVSGAGESPLPVSLTLRYQPKSHFTAKTGTNITNSGQGDAYLTFQKRGLLGLDETVTLDHRRDTGTNAGSNVSVLFPYVVPGNAYLSGKIDMFDAWKFLGVHDRGAAANLHTCYTPKSGKWNHSLTLDCIERVFHNSAYALPIKDTSTLVSEQLLVQEGKSLSSSLRWCASRDARDSTIAPTTGHMVKVDTQISAAPETATPKFIKGSCESNWVRSWLHNDFLTLSATGRAGYIHNLDPTRSYIHFADKFQSGGPNDVRSFAPMGLGPRSLGQPLGGDAMVAWGLSLFSRVPVGPMLNSGFRLHAFLNGGRLVNHNGMGLGDLARTLAQEHSTSVGLGLVLRHPMARFELNFAVPVTTHDGDMVRKGFQFGLGFEFL